MLHFRSTFFEEGKEKQGRAEERLNCEELWSCEGTSKLQVGFILSQGPITECGWHLVGEGNFSFLFKAVPKDELICKP